MNARAALLALFAVAACGGGPTAVELRLYPCAPPGGAAMSVALEIQSRDQDGAAIGEPLAKMFAISEPAVFSDGYATIGFQPPAGTVTADFTVIWSGGGAESTAHYMNVAVPALGETLVLGIDECDGATGTTGEPTTGTTATTDATATGTTGTSTTGGETTGTTDATTSTTGESTTGTTAATTDASTGTTGGDPQEGQPCVQGEPAVCDGGPGVLGTFLQCIDGTWTKSSPPCDVETVCPPELGLAQPQLVGCLGAGTNWTCACADNPVMQCAMGETSKCGPIAGGFKVDLCVLEDGELNHYVGKCNDCYDVQGEPLCVQ